MRDWNRLAVAPAMVLLVLALSGCQLSPEQQLVGRWYNSDMSMRFQPDGGVIFNSHLGKAEGRYFFDGTARPPSQDQRYENLILDVVRNGRRIRLSFQAEILTADRLRIHDLNKALTVNTRGERTDRVVVLKRATTDDVKTASL